MTDISVAIIIHVISVLWWIGGVAFVSTIVLPHIRKRPPTEAAALFEIFESRFKPQGRVAVLLVGISGLYMVTRLDLWARFLQLRFWWLDAMVLYWAVFMLLLFIPNHAGLVDSAQKRARDPNINWLRIQRMHWILLTIALVIIASGLTANYKF